MAPTLAFVGTRQHAVKKPKSAHALLVHREYAELIDIIFTYIYIYIYIYCLKWFSDVSGHEVVYNTGAPG